MTSEQKALRIESLKRSIHYTACPINKIHFEAELAELTNQSN